MAGRHTHRLARALATLALLASAPVGGAQARAAPPAADTPKAAAPSDAGAGEDHVFALVQAGKCAQAKAAALQQNDASLAGQIGLMCGARSSGDTAKGSGGGGRRGGGSGSGGGKRGGG